ncbi:hypothetical protein [Brevibacillus marinus]|uniref:hypothetical protein n=1 Tax=Brevibacillus marinus TaxID=2496837 RepID=UPI000F845459|nr:hypothetical protein [Brevibacillus marinus]
MGLFWFLLALACSFAAYLLEKKRWTTLVRTTEQKEFQQWCAQLDSLGIPYQAKTSILVQEHQPLTIYKIKVLARQAGRVKAPR